MNYSLPKSVFINGEEFKIRYDFKAILDILAMLNDPELSSAEKGSALITIFYTEPEKITDYSEAIKKCFEFIDCGTEDRGKSPKLVDWEQDFQYIVAPVNRVLGMEIRESDVHWWTFISAYMEIGSDCLFSQIVSIRDKQARGKKLEKSESEWLSRNRHLVAFKQRFTEEETNMISAWTGGGMNG